MLARASLSSCASRLRRPQVVFVAQRALAKKKRGGGGGGKKSGGGGGSGSRSGIDVCLLEKVHKTLPSGRVLFKDVSLRLLEGAKVGVLGANGAGKSSLLRIISGVDTDFEGTATVRGGTRVGMLEQEPKLDDERDVMSNVTDGVMEQRDALARFDEVNGLLASGAAAAQDEEALLTEQAELTERIEALDCWNLHTEVAVAMAALNCPSGDAMPAHLSGGQRRRVALCRLLLSKPDIMLLDEPTNHLDATSVAWVETYLAAFRGTVVAVTHDRYFLDNVASWILEIERGAALPFQGNYTAWLAHKASRLRQEERDEQALSSRLRDELEWIRTNPKGGRGRSKARVRSYEQLVEAQHGVQHAERIHTGAIAIAPGPRLGNQVLSATDLAARYGDHELFSGLNFELPAGAIMGVIGANGTGKTSLLKLIAGELEPHAGELRRGPSVQLGYASQTRDGLDDTKTVFEEISQGIETLTFGGRDVNVRAYVAAFNLRGVMQEKLVGSLSGGERGRVHLAKTLREGCNLLLLDEPSNDLDVDTLRSLEQALTDFAGSAVVISHDRWFLDRVCTHTLAFERGHVEFFEGSVSEYTSWRARFGNDADR